MKKISTLSILLFFSFTSIKLYAQQSKTTCESCIVLNNIDKYLPLLKERVENIMTQDDYDDTCLLLLIDKLEMLFIKTGKLDYLIAYNNIACQSDGAISEEFENTKMFYGNFKPYINYLYQNGVKNTCLQGFLERGLMFEVYYMPDSVNVKAENKIFRFIDNQERKYNFPKAEKSFLDTIMKGACEYGKIN